MQITRAIDESRTHNAHRQSLLPICLEREQFTLQLRSFIRISRRKRCILVGRCIARDAMYTRCTTMHDALQLLLLPTSSEQYARSLNVCLAIKFRWHTGVIQMPDEMVDQRDTIDRLLHPY